MALINFPQFQVEKHDELSKKGYWYFKAFRTGPASSGTTGFVYKPLHRKAALLALFMHIYLAVGILSILFVGSLNNFARENEIASIALLFVPVVLTGIFMLTKTYNAARKIHLEVNKNERKKLYTSEQSLYTTTLEGSFVCQSCSTPIATTSDVRIVEKPFITVSQLTDSDLVEAIDNQLTCKTCGTIVGTYTDNNYKLNGEKLALDAGELHLIYP